MIYKFKLSILGTQLDTICHHGHRRHRDYRHRLLRSCHRVNHYYCPRNFHHGNHHQIHYWLMKNFVKMLMKNYAKRLKKNDMNRCFWKTD